MIITTLALWLVPAIGAYVLGQIAGRRAAKKDASERVRAIIATERLVAEHGGMSAEDRNKGIVGNLEALREALK